MTDPESPRPNVGPGWRLVVGFMLALGVLAGAGVWGLVLFGSDDGDEQQHRTDQVAHALTCNLLPDDPSCDE